MTINMYKHNKIHKNLTIILINLINKHIPFINTKFDHICVIKLFLIIIH